LIRHASLTCILLIMARKAGRNIDGSPVGKQRQPKKRSCPSLGPKDTSKFMFIDMTHSAKAVDPGVSSQIRQHVMRDIGRRRRKGPDPPPVIELEASSLTEPIRKPSLAPSDADCSSPRHISQVVRPEKSKSNSEINPFENIIAAAQTYTDSLAESCTYICPKGCLTSIIYLYVLTLVTQCLLLGILRLRRQDVLGLPWC
jgi:hypothetical protein